MRARITNFSTALYSETVNSIQYLHLEIFIGDNSYGCLIIRTSPRVVLYPNTEVTFQWSKYYLNSIYSSYLVIPVTISLYVYVGFNIIMYTVKEPRIDFDDCTLGKGGGIGKLNILMNAERVYARVRLWESCQIA